jgi:uncharacterized protein DUF58
MKPSTKFRRVRDAFPLTTAGALLLAVTLLGTWIAGVGQSDVVLLVGGFTLVAFLGLSVLLVLIACLVIKRSLRSQMRTNPMTLEVGCVQATDFSLKVPSWLPFIQISWEWEMEDAPDVGLQQKGGRLHETVRPLHRGEFEKVVRRIVIRDNLRLAELGILFAQDQVVEILPASGHGNQLTLLNNMVAGDEVSNPKGDPGGDRVDIRQYTKGDSPKTILWKVFARSRKLMVKVPERALASRPRACCYQVATEQDEPAASLGRDLIQGDVLGDGWRFGADGLSGFCSNKPDSVIALMRSGNSSVRQKPSEIKHFLQRAAQDGYGCCFVLVGAQLPSQRLEAVRDALRVSPLKIVICLAVEGVRNSSVPGWQRWLASQSKSRIPDLDTLSQCWRFWGETNAEFRLVDRSRGGVYRDVPALLKILKGENK